MRSSASAFAWEFWQRHRLGFLALGGYGLVAAIVKLVIIARGVPVQFESGERFALVVMTPLATTFTYFLAVFTYGLDGDLAARESMYPARKFTLPVSTTALVAWPMLCGTIAMMLLWLGLRVFGLWPAGVPVPVIWPAIGAASLIAWTQALTWLPYPMRGLRVVIAVIWLGTIDAIALVAVNMRASETVMLAIFAPQIPFAFLVARYAVARARRGDVPDWSSAFTRQRADVGTRREPFASPARAQLWFEWRQYGRSLPAMIAILLPCELALLFLLDSHALIIDLLFGVLLTPPLMAAFAAATVRTSNLFTTTRPMSTAGLVAAKLKMTVASTLATWLLVLSAVPIAVALSHTGPAVTEFADKIVNAVGAPRAFLLAVLLIGGLVTATWKFLVQSMYIGLTGRASLIKGSVFVTLAVLTIAGPIVNWIAGSSRVQGQLWDAIPLILVVLVALKMSGAAYVAIRLDRSGLLSDRTLITGAVGWTLAVLVLFAVFVGFWSTPLIPSYLFGLIAILAVPLARVSAASLALAWNRHR